MNTKYKIEADNLAKAIDIANEVIKTYNPEGWDNNIINFYIKNNLETRDNVLNPEPKFANLTSLKYAIESVFTSFQESSGKAYDIFWQKIKEAGLPYKRENKLAKILKRGKINNDLEYNFIVDVMIPYQQEGLIDKNDIIKLNEMIGKFENKSKK
ncbi:MAG: hypothetical protein LBQ22_01510 [Bacteroidales bacterium]|jgi:hypothetical protein|nr:hypothetical protein [Bacteroidales bacterium]